MINQSTARKGLCESWAYILVAAGFTFCEWERDRVEDTRVSSVKHQGRATNIKHQGCATKVKHQASSIL